MATYIITYDLMKPGQNYPDLIKAVQNYKTYCHLQESVWLIVSEQSAVSVRDDLKKYIDANDKLFVAKVSSPAAWFNHGEKIGDWLKKFL